MRFVFAVFIIIAIIAVMVYIYFAFQEEQQLKADFSVLNARLEALVKENNELKAEIEYFSKPENLEKEIKTKFNYRKPDEKMMIIVP